MFANDKNYLKIRDYYHYTGIAHSICNLKFNVTNKIPALFHRGSNYDYHFIIKELVQEIDGKFKCLKENTKKYKAFPI